MRPSTAVHPHQLRNSGHSYALQHRCTVREPQPTRGAHCKGAGQWCVQARNRSRAQTSSQTGMRPPPEPEDEQEAFPLVMGLWWACQDLNLGPHPYQLNAGNRCADGRFRRSRPTVGAEVIRSIDVQVCVPPRRVQYQQRCAHHCLGLFHTPLSTAVHLHAGRATVARRPSHSPRDAERLVAAAGAMLSLAGRVDLPGRRHRVTDSASQLVGFPVPWSTG
jgi:hypothetical protein